MLRRLTAALALLTAIGNGPERIEVHVDPRVELMTIVARLAGFAEFDMQNSKSPYSSEVEAHFGKLREHAAVARLRKLRETRGVSHDAIPNLALHLGALPALEERIPFDTDPERLDARWGGAGAREFLTELRAFARESKADEFFERHRPFYAEVEKRLSERLSKSRAIPWFDGFFGARGAARYTAVPGLLCGGGNFGVGIRFPDGRAEEITPVFGCWTWDEQGVPVFDERYLQLFIHELCHSYTNPFVDRFEKELSGSGAKIHETCAASMKRQSYGNWKSMMYESLVRASVVRCRLATEGKEAAESQAREEVSHSFKWVPELALCLGEYESDRTKYASFDAFMPRVVAFFEAYAAKLAAARASAPHVSSIEPRNGATDVDPKLDRLVITFDREMTDRGWSFVGAKADMPEITGALAYDAAHKVLTVPIKLEAGRTYRFSLNSETSVGFTSKEGFALEPVAVTFTTRR